MMKDGRAGHSGLTERPILNELNVIVAEGAEKGPKVIVCSSEELTRKLLTSSRKSGRILQHICDTSGASSVSAMQSTMTSVWSRIRPPPDSVAGESYTLADFSVPIRRSQSGFLADSRLTAHNPLSNRQKLH